MEVEKYLNAKFKMIAKAIRDSGNKDEEDVIIKVCGRKYGYNFYPIVAVMTPNVLQPSKYADSSIPDYFRGEDPDNVWLKSQYYKYLLNFMFDDEDRKAFHSSMMKRALGIKQYKDVNELNKYSKPKVERDRDDRPAYVTVILDPVRVFSDMVTDMDRKWENFKVDIDRVERGKEEGDITYTILRKLVKDGNKKHEEDLRLAAKAIAQGFKK